MKRLTNCIIFLIFKVPLTFAQTEKPNAVFILVDDLAYSDVGYMHQKPDVNTPNIDRPSKNGMVFTNAYAACPVCSPTRASILTGKYPATLHLTCHIPGIGMKRYVALRNKGQKLFEAQYIDHLPLKEVTFAEVLKENGYKTAFFGKWHLAGAGSQLTDNGIVNERYDPNHKGFDINIGGCAYGRPVSYFSPYENGTISDRPTSIPVPLIFSFPEFTPKETICDVPVTSPYFFPTILDATGVKTRKYSNVPPKGTNLWPLLEKGKELSDRVIFWHFPHLRKKKQKYSISST